MVLSLSILNFYSCTSGSTKSYEFVFQSYSGLTNRLQWMKDLITTSSIHNGCTLASSHFIDCITVCLDCLINHIPLIIPVNTTCLSSLLPQLSLLRCTPSFLSSLSLSSSTKTHIFLSGELLYSSSLKLLQNHFPNALFYNIYGGMPSTYLLFLATETTGDCFCFSCSNTVLSHTVPIGSPIQGCMPSIQDNQLIIKGPILCLGTWRNGFLSSFNTGDLVTIQPMSIRDNSKTQVIQSYIITDRLASQSIIKLNGVRYSLPTILSHILECPTIIHAWIFPLEKKLGILIQCSSHSSPSDTINWLDSTYPDLKLHAVIKFLPISYILPYDKMNIKQAKHLFHLLSSSSSSVDETPIIVNTYDIHITSLDSLLQVIQSLLHSTIHEEDDLFDYGLDSLHSLILTEYLHKSGYSSFNRDSLLSHSTPLSLWEFLQQGVSSSISTKHSLTELQLPSHSYQSIQQSSSSWSILQTIPFQRCVDCNPLLIHKNILACCCHGGIFQVLQVDKKGVSVLKKKEFHKRIEKSLAYDKGIYVIGTYEGTVFFMTDDGKEECCNCGGEIRSSITLQETIGALCCYNGYLYIFNLITLSLSSLLFLNENCHCSPLIIPYQNKQYIFCCSLHRSIIICCLNNMNLSVVKKLTFTEPFFAEPIQVNDKVICITVKGDVIIVSIPSFDYNILQFPIKGLVYSKPLFHDILYITTTAGWIYGIDMNERIVVKVMTICEGESLSSLIPLLSSFVVCTTSGKVFEWKEEEVKMVCDLNVPVFSTPLVCNNCLCIGTRNNEMVFLQIPFSVCLNNIHFIFISNKHISTFRHKL